MQNENTAYGGPLAGVRVLDLTHVLAGPYCSLLLADLGADVIKIERPPHGDPVRQIHPLVEGQSSYFMGVNRNKRSLVLDLTHPDGLQVFYKLLGKADVVVDNFRPGVTERLGISYPEIARTNPRIITCSISAFGVDGPYRELPAFDLIVQAISGAMKVTGEANRPPVRIGLPIGDLGGGLFGALGIMAALFERERTGQGKAVDIAMLDGLISMLTYLAGGYFATGLQPERFGSGHPTIAPYQSFEASDGYLVVATLTQTFWANLCQVLDLQHLTDDPRFQTNALRVDNRATLIPILEDVFRQRTRDDWLDRLGKANVPAGPVNSVGEALSDPQVSHRNMVTAVDHPIAGNVRMTTTPLKALGPKDNDRPAPLLGQHTREVLLELGGYSSEAIDTLLAQGIVFTGESDD